MILKSHFQNLGNLAPQLLLINAVRDRTASCTRNIMSALKTLNTL